MAAVTVSRDTPIVLQARLIAGDQPVVGANINFYSKVTSRAGSPAGSRLGSERTDGQGNAALTLLLRSLEFFPGERATGFTAEFNPLNKIGDTLYCSSKSPVGEIRRT